jgi:uncharacterized metal-binding protein YceD (DUF177 family)
MPELIPRSPDNPDFARVIDVRTLSAADGFSFEIEPTAAELAALARLLGAQAVRKLRFTGQLSPRARGAWDLEGKLGATVVQTCVVSLEPVTTRIDQVVRRRFLAEAGIRAAELVVDPEEDDEVEPLGDRIDLGLVAIESLALALPAYPRKEGAELGETATDSAEEEKPKPFAALAALRGKMGEGP